jgi:hypothetical protein
MMTGNEALTLANGVLRTVGENPLSVPDQSGTERERVEAVFRAYVARLRKNQPRYQAFNDDRLLPDIVVQRIREELDKMK